MELINVQYVLRGDQHARILSPLQMSYSLSQDSKFDFRLLTRKLEFDYRIDKQYFYKVDLKMTYNVNFHVLN